MNLPKLKPGDTSSELISHGVFTVGRTKLVEASAGSTKTLFGVQYLAIGNQLFNQFGLSVTFKEQAVVTRHNLRNFCWNMDTWESEVKWTIPDVTSKQVAACYKSAYYSRNQNNKHA